MTSFDLLYIAQPVGVALSDEGPDKPQEPNLRDRLLQSTANAVRILVVEDHELARKTNCDLLRSEEGFEVICEAENGLEGVRAAEKVQPDVVVLDVTSPGVQCGSSDCATSLLRGYGTAIRLLMPLSSSSMRSG